MQVKTRELFTCVRTEGALLPPELLQRVSDLDRTLPGLTPEAYHLLPTETFGEAINRSWTRLVGAWTAFSAALASVPETDPATTLTRERWLQVLMGELGYGRLTTAHAITVDGRAYPVSHGWGHLPIHMVGAHVSLDERTAGIAGAARQSPHSLVQELLNADDGRLWGVVTNGLRLRLLRDNARLTRQAFVEFDLQAMMNGEVYSDFALLWMVCHQSRVEAETPEETWLERWSAQAAEQGTRARDSLRDGVESAITALGAGFLAHPDSRALREALRDGTLSAQDYYRQLLRLVYRLLFLFVAEDREVLLRPDAAPEARARYTDHYSTRRLRDLAARRRGGRHADLWQALTLVMRWLGDDSGAPGLALPALGSFLWSAEATPNVTDARIANRDLLEAVRRLAFVEADHTLRPVDYRNLGAEELGSVYESLLELHPELEVRAESPSFHLATAAGHERKQAGAYYTPTSLIVELLDSALDPVLDRAASQGDPEAAILDLSVCDPACGSGHVLIAAAQRVAKRLATVRTGDAEPAPEAVRRALRDVVGRCIYGVDVNPMAVELCKVSLWMEATEPGRPLSFLDHRIVVGNSLLGATPALVAAGVPDDAFTALLGDDRKTVTALKKRNKLEREGQLSFGTELTVDTSGLARQVDALEDVADDDIAGLRERERRHRDLLASQARERARWAADAWCAAFICPKGPGEPVITTETVRRLANDPTSVPQDVRDRVAEIASAHRFLHWHVAFPEVFRVTGETVEADDGPGWQGGFDCVLGNPPWERIKLQVREWFAVLNPDIALAPTKSAQNRLLQELAHTDPELWHRWTQALRSSEEVSHLARQCGRFDDSAVGDVNTYALFADLMASLISREGRVGCVVQSGLATDATMSKLFSKLLTIGMESFFEFENEGFFPGAGAGHMNRFCLLTLASHAARYPTRFLFRGHAIEDIRNDERVIPMGASDIALVNPVTRTAPVFFSYMDYRVSRKVAARLPLLAHGWHPDLLAMIHASSDAAHIAPRKGPVPDGHLVLYEARFVQQFCHRYSDYVSVPEGVRPHRLPPCTFEQLNDPDYVVVPFASVPAEIVNERLRRRRWTRGWLLGWRDVTDSRASARTAIAAVIPRVAVDGGFSLLIFRQEELSACLLGNINSFAFDFLVRQRVGGTHLKIYHLEQTPFVAADTYRDALSFDDSRTMKDWVSARVVELSYTAHDLRAFAADMGYQGAPFRWDEERRFLLRAELDAAYFHLYGLERDDVEHVMDSFPIVRRRDEARYDGEYRTKWQILEIYDAMADAARTGVPYETLLDPPPAHDDCRHPTERLEASA